MSMFHPAIGCCPPEPLGMIGCVPSLRQMQERAAIDAARDAFVGQRAAVVVNTATTPADQWPPPPQGAPQRSGRGSRAPVGPGAPPARPPGRTIVIDTRQPARVIEARTEASAIAAQSAEIQRLQAELAQLPQLQEQIAIAIAQQQGADQVALIALEAFGQALELIAQIDQGVATELGAAAQQALEQVMAAAGASAAVGDTWGDVLNVARTVDQALDRVWNTVKDVVPYGQQIDQLHRARMDAMYGPGSPLAQQPAPAPSPTSPATPRQQVIVVPTSSIPSSAIPMASSRARFHDHYSRAPSGKTPSEIDQELATLRGLVARAAAGADAANLAIEQIRQGAAAGDPEQRRRWKTIKLLKVDRAVVGQSAPAWFATDRAPGARRIGDGNPSADRIRAHIRSTLPMITGARRAVDRAATERRVDARAYAEIMQRIGCTEGEANALVHTADESEDPSVWGFVARELDELAESFRRFLHSLGGRGIRVEVGQMSTPAWHAPRRPASSKPTLAGEIAALEKLLAALGPNIGTQWQVAMQGLAFARQQPNAPPNLLEQWLAPARAIRAAVDGI